MTLRHDKNFLLSIIIPVYNSNKTIKEVVKRIRNTFQDRISFEVVLIDDGSKDNSLRACLELSNEYKYIKVIALSKNFGQHNAIMAGLNHVRGDYVLFMDDDLQTPPEEAWKLIEKLDEGYDAVYGKYIDKKHGGIRNLGSRMRDWAANTIFSKPRHVRLSSYFIIRRFLVDEIIKYTGPYTYIGGLILRATDNIENVLVGHKEREYGRSNYTFTRLIGHWLNSMVNFTVKPLRISFLTGISCFVASIIFSIFLLIRKLIEPGIQIGWTSIILAVLFFSSIQLIIIGLIGEYVGRMFLFQNKQPQFVIKDKYNIENDQ